MPWKYLVGGAHLVGLGWILLFSKSPNDRTVLWNLQSPTGSWDVFWGTFKRLKLIQSKLSGILRLMFL